MTKKPSWDDTFIEICYTMAKRSKDRSTQIGCVIVGPNKEPRALGYNGFPRGCDDDVEDRHERPAKYHWAEHGERNAIYNATRTGVSLEGCVLYIPAAPCAPCARAIVQSGIKEVICASLFVPERYKESCDIALEMLAECEIAVRRPNSDIPVRMWVYDFETEVAKQCEGLERTTMIYPGFSPT